MRMRIQIDFDLLTRMRIARPCCSKCGMAMKQEYDKDYWTCLQWEDSDDPEAHDCYVSYPEVMYVEVET